MNIELNDVVVVGELNVDIILNNIESLPTIGKEIIAEKMIITLGSSSAIFASNLSTLGAKVGFIGKIGNDDFARNVLNSLQNKQVDCSQISKSATYNTGATIVLNYEQDRANITYPGAMNDLTINDIDFNYLKKFKHLHVSSLFLQPALKPGLVTLFKKAKEIGLTTSIDPQWDPLEKWDIPMNELLPLVDVFLPNTTEICALTGTTNMNEAITKIKHLSDCIVIKDGSNGAYCWNGNELLHQPSFLNNEIADCIGAGDSFNAGFIFRYINKQTLPQCLEFGALAGAVNTTKAGGTTAFNNLENVRNTAKEKFGYTF